jgi:hypothetical protein
MQLLVTQLSKPNQSKDHHDYKYKYPSYYMFICKILLPLLERFGIHGGGIAIHQFTDLFLWKIWKRTVNIYGHATVCCKTFFFLSFFPKLHVYRVSPKKVRSEEIILLLLISGYCSYGNLILPNRNTHTCCYKYFCRLFLKRGLFWDTLCSLTLRRNRT